ncbi:hypothetical protein GCM10010245_55990 [Streptomyces spectabilis]|uniref:Uncharacterized protein n=2 Tax=Streptomyces spectabilis TaxID=68270 RepID=A0A7W8ESP1_STRST|nr:DUF6214 family protein [Streptomyces spectabilis]MBB5101890.1 hypothetical protein [Streptomyces spectabilis]GGV34889.1 hypothetical protein GCM10010245_55990 [Streptomyces spectabilis]
MLESSFFDESDHYPRVAEGAGWPGADPLEEWPPAPQEPLDPMAYDEAPRWAADPSADTLQLITSTDGRLDARRPGSEPASLLHVRLDLDGAHVDVLAAVCEGRVAIEDLRARPPLPLPDLVALADRIEGPLADVCRGVAQQYGPADASCRGALADEAAAAHRARPAEQRGDTVRQAAVEAYRTARDEGRDPVLAVMCATGHSRRKSLRLIAGARDAGHLSPRHRRR